MVNGRCQVYVDGALASKFFGDMNTPGMVAIAILIMMVILGLGLWFVHLNSPDDKNNKRKENNYDYTRN